MTAKFIPGTDTMLTVSYSNKVSIWDLKTAQLLSDFEGPKSRDFDPTLISGIVAVSSNGNFIVTGIPSMNLTVWVRDPDTAHQHQRQDTP